MPPTFHADLATGKSKDHDALARQIAVFVDADTTEPEATNRDAWNSDYTLRNLEKPIGYDAGQWEWYTDICSRAASFVENPSAKALLLLGQFNGERRVKDPDVDLIKSLIEQSATLIDSLENGPRKERLLSLREYHIGIWCRRSGDYLLAARQQDESASRAYASGDMPGASIAYLCAAVERFNHALGEGAVSYELFNRLDEAARQVVDTCTDSDTTQTRWRLHNAPAHVLLAHIWGDNPLTESETSFWMNLLTKETSDPDTVTLKNRGPLITAIRAGLAYLKNQPLEAHSLASKVVSDVHNTETSEEALMTAHLILARVAVDAHLRIIFEQGGDMYQLRRFARLILEGTANVFPTATARATL
jgi:hypothetical protein